MTNTKTYLNVPYAEKDTAKALGAKWDPAKKKWYAPADVELSSFSKWHTELNPLAAKIKKTKSGSSVNSSLGGVMTYAKDKSFVAYSGEQPPWD